MKARDEEIRKAVEQERARCLWCLDQLMKELRKDLDKKILEEHKIHLIKVKVQIAQAIVTKARRMIMAAVEPGRIHE